MAAAARPIDRLLRPALRAYLLGYAFTTGPRLLSLLRYRFLLLRRRRHDPSPFLHDLRCTLSAGLAWDRFATFCAALVGACTVLEVCLSTRTASLDRSTAD